MSSLSSVIKSERPEWGSPHTERLRRHILWKNVKLLLCVGVNDRLNNAAVIHVTAVVQPACPHHINENTDQLWKQLVTAQISCYVATSSGRSYYHGSKGGSGSGGRSSEKGGSGMDLHPGDNVQVQSEAASQQPIRIPFYQHNEKRVVFKVTANDLYLFQRCRILLFLQ